MAFAAFSCLRDPLGRCTIDESRSFTISIDACMQRVRYALAEKAGSREQRTWGGEHVNPSVDVVQASSKLACCWYPIISGVMLYP